MSWYNSYIKETVQVYNCWPGFNHHSIWSPIDHQERCLSAEPGVTLEHYWIWPKSFFKKSSGNLSSRNSQHPLLGPMWLQVQTEICPPTPSVDIPVNSFLPWLCMCLSALAFHNCTQLLMAVGPPTVPRHAAWMSVVFLPLSEGGRDETSTSRRQKSWTNISIPISATLIPVRRPKRS